MYWGLVNVIRTRTARRGT